METIQGRKQFKGEKYLRKYGMIKNFFAIWIGQVQSRLVTYELVRLKVRSHKLDLIEFALYKCQKEFPFVNGYLLPFRLLL